MRSARNLLNLAFRATTVLGKRWSHCARTSSFVYKCPFCGGRVHSGLCVGIDKWGGRGCQVRAMSGAAGRDDDVLFRQLMDYKSYTFTYILADKSSGDAIIIDPVLEMVERDCQIVRDLKLNLVYAVNTHVHADHITGSGEIKKRIPGCRSMIADVSKAVADVKLTHGDLIKFGKFQLECRSTPGHTDGCMTYVWQDKGMVFTGDALLIRGCGRTDFQQGNAGTLYDSVHKNILSLPPDFRLFPAHDYTGQSMTTVREEKQFNPRLTKPREQFIKLMEDLNLPYPKQIDRALPANMVCGVFDVSQAGNS